jgi:iron complex transport system ATP-binding protein
MLRVEHVGVRRGERRLLQDITHAFAPGRVTGLLGPNGAGKTTLLNVLSGAVVADAGHVNIAGRAIRSWPPALLSRHRAVVPQATSLGFDFTVAEVVMLGIMVPGFALSSDADAVVSTLHAVGLTGLESRMYLTLSGGERQRVHIARALCQLAGGRLSPEATALLLDEPTASLDPAHQALVLDLARREAASGRTVVVVLHDLNLAAAWCDEVVILVDGRLAATGAPNAVLTDKLLATVYKATFRVSTPPADAAAYVLPHHTRPHTKTAREGTP